MYMQYIFICVCVLLYSHTMVLCSIKRHDALNFGIVIVKKKLNWKLTELEINSLEISNTPNHMMGGYFSPECVVSSF